MDITFACEKCGQHVVIDVAGAGQQLSCPKCAATLTVPGKTTVVNAAQPTDSSPTNLQNCQDCGRQVSKRATSCPHCGAPITPSVAPAKSENNAASIMSSNAANPLAKIFITVVVIAVLLGSLFVYNLATNREFKDWLKTRGNAKAQYELGCEYKYGWNHVQQDYIAAAKWFREAAEQGYAPAQEHLGVAYDTGEGIEKNWIRAEEWHRKAAEQGNATAQWNLGNTYLSRGDTLHEEFGLNDTVKEDFTQAAEWYRKAAEQKDTMAQWSLARLYKDGKGVQKDYVEAYVWYNLAAQGDRSFTNDCNGIAPLMTPEQIAEAQKRISEFLTKKKSQSQKQ